MEVCFNGKVKGDFAALHLIMECYRNKETRRRNGYPEKPMLNSLSATLFSKALAQSGPI